MALIWRESLKDCLSETEKTDFEEMNNTEYFNTLMKLDTSDPKRLLALDPARIKGVLDEGTLTAGDLFHVTEDLVMLRRTLPPFCQTRRSRMANSLCSSTTLTGP